MKLNKVAMAIALSMLMGALLASSIPQAQAAPKVDITFTAAGYTDYSGAVITIDSTTYSTWNLPVTLKLNPGDTYTVTATPSVTSWSSIVYKFSSWTNGNGLTTNTGTFTVPATDTTVTANYAQSTHTAQFAASGLTNFDSNILNIDGTDHTYSSLPYTTFLWEPGSTHTVTAASPVYSWDSPAIGYAFQSWTNGNGLTTASGTFTMPASDITVTANYAQFTVGVTFEHSGLSNLDAGQTVLTIDGTEYDYWDVQNTNFQWTIGSTHAVTASPSITGHDSVTHYFQSWTNGNGLTTESGTFTVPSTDVVVTVNYDTTAPSTTSSTTLTVSCSQESVDKGNAVTISGILTSSNVGVAGKTVTLTYYDGITWNPIGSATTNPDGTYSYDWTVPDEIANGVYPVKADFAGDSNYLASTASTGTTGNGGSLTVLPESWSSIVALLACLAGALTFFKLRSKRPTTR